MTTWYNLSPQPNWQEWVGVTVSANPTTFTFSANALTDIITISGDSNYFTGKAVMVSSTELLPTPLNESSVYYIIFLSSTTFKLATTYQNAIDAVAINLTDAGSGTLSIVSTGVVYMQPNANGRMYTYSSLDHGANKTTYTDWTGNTENTNPIVFDDRGMATIYWKVNDLLPNDNYYIEVYNANGTLMYSRDNFNAPPGMSTSSDNDTTTLNLLLNNQFDFWGMYDYDNIDVTANCSVINGPVDVAYYWHFDKSNDNATDILSRQTFAAGQTDVPNSPIYYCRIECTSAGAGGETYKRFYQKLTGVQNCSGQTVTFSFYARASTNGVQVTPVFIQNFGGGGSATVTTEGDDISLTTSFARYDVTVDVPSLSGKSIGTDSYLAVGLELPINSTYQIDKANTQLTVSDSFQGYHQTSFDERFTALQAGCQAVTGDIKVQAFGAVPYSWIPLEDGTIGNGSSGGSLLANPNAKSLFLALWTNYNDALCPVYTSAGVRTTRGSTALEDFNANKQIRTFYNAGRGIVNTGSQAINFNFSSPNDGSNTILVNGDYLYASGTLYAGTPIQATSTGTLPTGISAATTYFIIVIDKSTGTYKLATSYVNAIAGTPIAISSAGTGILQLTVLAPEATIDNLQTTVAGQAKGQAAHTQVISELAGHTHQFTAFDSGTDPIQDGFSGSPAATTPTPKTSTSTGSNATMNVTNPYLALPHIIKL